MSTTSSCPSSGENLLIGEQAIAGVTAVNGVHGYCSCCSTRNDVQELTLTRERIKAGEPLVP